MRTMETIEMDIEAERLAMIRADNHNVRVIHWQNMKNLEAMRSQDQIDEIERERLLR